MLTAFIVAGLGFMLLPGTFLGVWNLFAISNRHSAQGISDAWIQAHGHAQVFGWIGCFLLGIGYHSIPKMTGAGSRNVLRQTMFSLAAWVSGVTLRWFANIYLWHWRTLLPLSAALELAAFLVFFATVSRHKPAHGGKSKLEPWVFVVMAGSLGWLFTLLVNLYGCVKVALQGAGPAFPSEFDQRFLVLMAWGFLVPHIWGFSAKWLPVFLGLKPIRPSALIGAVVVNVAGVLLAASGRTLAATVALFIAASIAAFALRIFERAERPAKVNGIHISFPWFVRISYVWIEIASCLGIGAASSADANGIWGASRHALTVGFISLMVFCIGQRILPAFSGMKLLWSPRLMLAACSLLVIGCVLRVASEVIAYQRFGVHAWRVLPISAVVEMTAVTLFAINLLLTFSQPPASQVPNLEVATNSRKILHWGQRL